MKSLLVALLFGVSVLPGLTVAQVQLPTVNLGLTNFEDGFAVPGWFLQEFPDYYDADKFKDTIPVILNLQGTDTDLSKRLIDFSSGLTYALDGGMQRIADKVFMLTPHNVEVSAEERARLIEKGFFNQS